jgi:mannuronan 5-epimerase
MNRSDAQIKLFFTTLLLFFGVILMLGQPQSAANAQNSPTATPLFVRILQSLQLTPQLFLPAMSNPYGPTALPATQTPTASPTPVPTITSTPNVALLVRVSGGVTYTKRFKDGYELVTVDGPGKTVTLPQIAAVIGDVPTVIGPFLVLEDPANGVWKLNGALRIINGATLRMTPETVRWLKIRSDTSTQTATIDRGSFGFVDSIDGNILIDGIKVTSWDIVTNDYDKINKNGRAFLRAEGRARMDIRNSEIAYLGNPEGSGSYGISWRDETEINGQLAAQATGDVINTDFHHNYYGFFSYAASDMTIRGNKFRDSDSYGFDPHDFTHDVLVEDNEAYDNGNHGFIISRGCYNFVFRRNKAYRNVYKVNPNATNRAHGFMIDPGGLESDGGPYTPSFNNLLEDNEAYDNQGYGLRLLDAYTNTIRNNIFRNNLRGITIERGSRGNIIENNTITGNPVPGGQPVTDYGIQLVGAPQFGYPDNNVIRGNTIVQFSQDAILVDGFTTNTRIENNVIGLSRRGIRASENSTLNFWSQNSIYTMTLDAIKLEPLAGNPPPVPNFGIAAPMSLTVSGLTVSGVAQPNSTVEIFSDNAGFARFYEGVTTADGAGNFSVTISGPWRGNFITAINSLPDKGSSRLAGHITRPPP